MNEQVKKMWNDPRFQVYADVLKLLEGCTEWLNTHVGKGNITGFVDDDDYAWFYRRERVYPQGHEAFEGFDLAPKYVPTITVKDEKLAMWFVLKWAS